ncbi:adenylyl cyclase [Trypanosoma grayi]|uniref:adenylyl cyclase n=1 Tax=Trypanosoma grayi TaxID=71804 RepID=UPI0004F4BA7F|nr:adenylyl cyclase [Trypanosoma grayi]KEG13507.1 adenylyl cyclase [Trypanosoma grayi]
MKRFVEGYRAENILSGELTIPALTCYTDGMRLRAPLNGAALLMTDDAHAVRATLAMITGAAAALGTQLNVTDANSITLELINASTTDAKTALRDEMERKRIHAVGGVVTQVMLNDESLVFIDPQNIHPWTSKFRRHVLRLSPTLEQEFFVLAQYLGSTTNANAHAVIRNDEAVAMVDVLQRSLVTFGGSLLSSALLAGGDALGGYLPRKGDVFVVGIAAADVAVIAEHLARHRGARVFLLFTEFSFLYDEFVAAFNGSAAAGRLVFATSLPHWADESTTSETVQLFHAAVKDKAKWAPFALRSFATTLAVKSILSRMELVNAQLLVDFFYKNIAITVADMFYGPFKDGEKCGLQNTVNATECAVNYGATYISVWSMARVLDPAVPELFPAVTPSMEYGEPDKNGLSDAQLIGIIVGPISGGVLLAALFAFFCCCAGRDNNNAPKEPTDPVTLVFTDIESSTALWAACPEIMPDAVATHHRLIRSLIATYRCYEVKTIGDSFMIACKSAWAAVQLARDIQQTLLQHDWGSGAIDAAYHEFEEGRAAEDEEYVPPTARLDAAVYRAYWNGLRVRVGVHTGLCDIRHDEVTKGYDYYGRTSNTASRTESVGNGGQVLLTGAAYLALSTAEREQLDVTALGGVALRGVPVPVEMYQLNAVPGRTFAALRSEASDASDEEHFESTSDLSGDSRNSCYDTLFSFARRLFSPFIPRQRADVLVALCGRWRLSLPARGDESLDEYCLCLLAILVRRAIFVVGHNEDVSRGTASLLGSLTATVSSVHIPLSTSQDPSIHRAGAEVRLAALPHRPSSGEVTHIVRPPFSFGLQLSDPSAAQAG